MFTFFVMVVAAAEAAVGLAIILTVFKNRATLNIDEVEFAEELTHACIFGSFPLFRCSAS